jgi:hypothetical protein
MIDVDTTLSLQINAIGIAGAFVAFVAFAIYRQIHLPNFNLTGLPNLILNNSLRSSTGASPTFIARYPSAAFERPLV